MLWRFMNDAGYEYNELAACCAAVELNAVNILAEAIERWIVREEFREELRKQA